jgi:hypothetical protein
MEKKKSIKDTLDEIKMMRKASKERQQGKNTTSEDIKARMEKREMDKAKQDLKAQKKDARKAGRKFSMPKDKSQYVAPDGREYMGPGGGPKRERKAKEATEQTPKKAPRRRPTGREEMIAQRYMDNEKNKKNGPVVGS